MSLFDLPLSEWTESHITDLVAAGASEDSQLEFKRDLPSGTDTELREFLADVTSFANTNGGVIIYGIAEVDGTATAIHRIPQAEVDHQVLRLDSVIRTGSEPRLAGVDVQPIACGIQGSVIAVRISASYKPPHAVTRQGGTRFYGRGSAGKFQMDVSQIRSAILGSEAVFDRINQFRTDRLIHIKATDTNVSAPNKPAIVLHLIPLSAARSVSFMSSMELAATFEPRTIYDAFRTIPEFHFGGGLRDFVLEGFRADYGVSKDNTPNGYHIAFRNGGVEIVDHSMLRNHIFPTLIYEERIVVRSLEVLEAQRTLGAPVPTILMLSLLNVNGCTLGINGGFPSEIRNRIERDDLIIPGIELTQHPAGFDDLAKTLKPVFDYVWTAAGWPGSYNYDSAGNWNKPPHRR